ncbi:hypothetical protein ADUPG1_011883 [Aduncisulcus paluster]|uniref:Anaphase-promoting complex subunit 11 n=1 Tax=Aduncisulcus paluster TaxID=2918883 RepID=A0ABQ5JXH1_9EUKA|nr:hypothetical protein ADUPG1_011883 [Aduncisulcus paluster]
MAEKPYYTVTSFEPQYYWSWDTGTNETCGICFGEFDDGCPKCSAPCLDCTVTKCPCGHEFHTHCLAEWMAQGKAKCPLCRSEW